MDEPVLCIIKKKTQQQQKKTQQNPHNNKTSKWLFLMSTGKSTKD